MATTNYPDIFLDSNWKIKEAEGGFEARKTGIGKKLRSLKQKIDELNTELTHFSENNESVVSAQDIKTLFNAVEEVARDAHTKIDKAHKKYGKEKNKAKYKVTTDYLFSFRRKMGNYADCFKWDAHKLEPTSNSNWARDICRAMDRANMRMTI